MRKYIDFLDDNRVNGAHLASPLYKPYKKVWLRDHSMITLLKMRMGMDVSSEVEWIVALLCKEDSRIKKLFEKDSRDEAFYNADFHPAARYTPNRDRFESNWLERQYDGVALAVLVLMEYDMQDKHYQDVVEDYLNYLFYVWPTPCADLWEMHEQALHTYTLGLIAYTLKMAEIYTGDSLYMDKASKIISFITKKLTHNGILSKMLVKDTAVGYDASNLLLLSRFDIFKDKKMIKDNLLELYAKLSPDGKGLFRFIIPQTGEQDVYFGGGIWFITTYWAGHIFIDMGDTNTALRMLNYHWSFPLGEQVSNNKLIQSKKGLLEWIIQSKRENNGIEGPAFPLNWTMAEYAYLKYRLQNLKK